MSLGYVLKEGCAGFGRAKLASFTSMFSLFIAVFLIGVMARVAFNAYKVGQALKQSVKVEVFLEDLDQMSEQNIREKLEKAEIVNSITYISKDSAAAIFQNEFGAEGAALANLKFLPASFKISLNDDTQLEAVKSFINEIENYRGVDEVAFNQQLLEVLETRFRNLVLAGSAIVFLILFTSMVLVFNTIRLTIYAKRGLIKAMKLVGATNNFIRRPFLVEGVLQGVLAGGFGIFMHYALFQYVVPRFLPQMGILAWPLNRWYYLTGGLMLLSILMGYFGSRWAARRFIKNVTVS